MLDERQAVNALTRITRLAQREPDKRALLRRALEQDLATLAPLALQVGIETGEPMPSTLAETLAEDPRGAQAAARVEQELPRDTVAMLDVAEQVTAARVAGLEPGSPELPAALVAHAERLVDVGAAEEAAEAAWRGVALLRERGDDRRALANALMVASRCEHARGERAASLPPAREAVAIERELADGAPDVRLAGALMNVANRLTSADEAEEALACYQEATELFRRMIAAAPRRVDYQVEDAVDSGAEKIWINLTPGPGSAPPPPGAAAVEVNLATGEPSALRQGLALALMNTVDLLLVGGRAPEAARDAGEAVELLRDLAAERRDAYRLHLAAALLWQAGACADTDAEHALSPAKEAVESLREIETEHPGAATAQLGFALVTLSIVLARLGRLEASLEVTRELDALGWADEGPLLAQLVKQYETLSAHLDHEGDRSAAVTASRASVDAARRAQLAEGPPADGQLGAALHNLSRRLRAVGGDADASAASAEAVGLIGPSFLRGEVDARTMGAILWQYVTTAESAGLPLDAALGVADLVARVAREGSAGTRERSSCRR